MLRTLTLKSQLKFSKLSDYTIEQIFQIKKEQNLRWIYYNSSNINFVPEVLEMLGITHTIEKPGVDREYWETNKTTFLKPREKQELTVAQASFFKHIGNKTKRNKTNQVDRLTGMSKEALMHKNRKK